MNGLVARNDLERDPFEVAAALAGALLSRVIDEHAPHRLRGEGEEVMAIVDDVGAVHEAQIRLVDERGRLQRVLPGFAAHVASRQLMKLRVQGAHDAVRGVGVAAAHTSKQRGQISTAG